MSDENKPAETVPETPAEGPAADSLEARAIEVLRTIYDPEIPVDIYQLGLIYGVETDEELGKIHIRMTLTSPACPVAGTLPGEVETKVAAVEGAEDVFVELVWDPPWNMDRLSEAAKLQLGLM